MCPTSVVQMSLVLPPSTAGLHGGGGRFAGRRRPRQHRFVKRQLLWTPLVFRWPTVPRVLHGGGPPPCNRLSIEAAGATAGLQKAVFTSTAAATVIAITNTNISTILLQHYCGLLMLLLLRRLRPMLRRLRTTSFTFSRTTLGLIYYIKFQNTSF